MDLDCSRVSSDHALALAARFGSRVDVLFLHGSVDPLTIESNPFFGDAREIAEVNWSQEESARLDVETRLDRWSRERGVPYLEAITNQASPHLLFLEVRSDWAQALQDHGRTSDLIVIGQPGREMTAMDVAINKLSVMASGRSVLTVPNEPPPAENILAHILIAWDGGLQASQDRSSCNAPPESCSTAHRLYIRRRRWSPKPARTHAGLSCMRYGVTGEVSYRR